MGTQVTRHPPPARRRAGNARWGRSLGSFAVWLLAYALWVASAALAVLAIPLTRTLVVRLSVALRTGPWLLGALDKFGMLLLAMLWLGWVVYTEATYRRAIGQGLRRLLVVAARATLVVLVVLALLTGTIWALRRPL